MKSDPINPTDFPRPPLWESVASLASLAMLLAGNLLLSRFPIAGICMIGVSLALVSWFFVRDLRRRGPRLLAAVAERIARRGFSSDDPISCLAGFGAGTRPADRRFRPDDAACSRRRLCGPQMARTATPRIFPPPLSWHCSDLCAPLELRCGIPLPLTLASDLALSLSSCRP